MPLQIPIGGMERVDLTDGLARWRDLSRSPNREATRPWIQHVLEPHDDYVVTGDWLDSETVNNDVCFDVSGLDGGDIIKVSGATARRKQHNFYRVLENDGDTLRVERITADAAVEAVEEPEEESGTEEESEERSPVEALRVQIIEELAECDDDRVLWEVLDTLETANM